MHGSMDASRLRSARSVAVAISCGDARWCDTSPGTTIWGLSRAASNSTPCFHSAATQAWKTRVAAASEACTAVWV